MKYSLALSLSLLLLALAACNRTQNTTSAKESLTNPPKTEMEAPNYIPPEKGEIQKITKSEKEWKKELSEQEFYVLREAGTERAFSGDLLKNKTDGIYTCAACGLPLFDAGTKFKSGTGWPSFYQPIDSDYIIEKADRSYGMTRTEVLCARCDGHLGHVFNDGPKPTGLRYCLNSVSLDFVSREKLSQQEP